jgi:hypothetical protein
MRPLQRRVCGSAAQSPLAGLVTRGHHARQRFTDSRANSSHFRMSIDRRVGLTPMVLSIASTRTLPARLAHADRTFA